MQQPDVPSLHTRDSLTAADVRESNSFSFQCGGMLPIYLDIIGYLCQLHPKIFPIHAVHGMSCAAARAFCHDGYVFSIHRNKSIQDWAAFLKRSH